MTAREIAATPNLTQEEFEQLQRDCGFTESPGEFEVPADSLLPAVVAYGQESVRTELRRGACPRDAIAQALSEQFRLGVAWGRRHPVPRGEVTH